MVPTTGRDGGRARTRHLLGSLPPEPPDTHIIVRLPQPGLVHLLPSGSYPSIPDNMNPFVNENRIRNLANALLFLHGPVRRQILCDMIYLCDADHYELYEDEITWSVTFLTDGGPEPMGFDDIVDDPMPELRIGGDYLSCGPRYPDLQMFCDSELETMKNVACLALDLGDEDFHKYVMTDTPIRIADVGEKVDLNAVFYRDESRSVRIYEDDEAE